MIDVHNFLNIGLVDITAPIHRVIDKQISTACMALIQNAIVLWNTLYLSQRLSSTSNTEEQRDMLNAITGGSLLTWQHVNLQGEYD